MKASELRISNLILKNGKLHYTSHLTIRDIHGLSVDDTDTFEPIPITEDWLVKFGFKLEADEGDIKYYEIQRLWYYVVFDHDDIRLDIKTDKDMTHTVFYMDERFMYLHQLQNLYFALTGEELTINQ